MIQRQSDCAIPNEIFGVKTEGTKVLRKYPELSAQNPKNSPKLPFLKYAFKSNNLIKYNI